MRVLLLEDEPDVADAIATGLAAVDETCEVQHVGCLVEAENLVKVSHFDVALVDLTLPDARDAEAVITLRVAAPDLPLVAFTGKRFDSMAMQLASVGVQDYLEKGNLSVTRVHQVLRLAAVRHARESKLLEQSRRDPLTGALNRADLSSLIEKAIGHSERTGFRAAVAVCDINDFKSINDEHGHATGDAVLKEVVERLSSVIRKGDSVGRLGGDEFVVILEGIPDRTDMRIIAEKLCAATTFDYAAGETSIPVSMSIGIAIAPTHGRSATALLESADIAMYQAKKKNNLGCFRFSDR